MRLYKMNELCEIKNKLNRNYKLLKIIFSNTFLFIYLFIQKDIKKDSAHILFNNKKRVGVTCLQNSQNVGNILVKYAMLKKLEEFGFNATILVPANSEKCESYFTNKTINSNLFIIKNNYSEELQQRNFDYLMVNSDQTWAFSSWKYFYDVGFLRFAKTWEVKKFVYGASIGKDKWNYNKNNEEEMKKLLTNFTGISYREIGLVKLVEKHLGLKGVFVLDPTLIIDKQYYLNEIKDYKGDFNSNENFIFVYQLDNNTIIQNVIKDIRNRLNYKINKFEFDKKDNIESFIFGISKCQAVITDSYHGTIFSIIFNKPFITFINKYRGKGRFDSLIEVFNLNNRIIDLSKNIKININLLKNKPNINRTLLNHLRNFSLNYLKKNLDIL